jgi:hypothetical protein
MSNAESNWNIDLWSVCPAELNSAVPVKRGLGSGLQTRWAHRLKVYVPTAPSSFKLRQSFIALAE